MALEATPPKSPGRRLIKAALAGYHFVLEHFTRDGRRGFFDPASLPWVADLEAHWKDIAAEADALLAEAEHLPRLDQVEPDSADIAIEPWRLCVLRIYGRDVPENAARCPRTAALVARVPEISTALLSVLRPGRIPPHRGPFKGVLRYHLAVRVPEQGRCQIRVGDEWRSWQEGGSLLFDDTLEHEVVNDSQEVRIVLFADVVRPLPWPLSSVNRLLIALAQRTPDIRAIQENARRYALPSR